MSIHSEVITNFVPRVELDKQTAAFKIWNYRFQCAISQMHLSTVEHKEQGGTLLSGDPRIDRALANEKVIVNITVAAMAEYMEEGIPFNLSRQEDSAIIYRMIHEHLTDWKVAMESNPGMMDAPIADLRKFDTLAGEMYVFARHYFSEKPFHGKLFATLNAVQMRRGGLSRNIRPTTADGGVVNNAPLTHSPMAESISKMATERKKSWR